MVQKSVVDDAGDNRGVVVDSRNDVWPSLAAGACVENRSLERFYRTEFCVLDHHYCHTVAYTHQLSYRINSLRISEKSCR